MAPANINRALHARIHFLLPNQFATGNFPLANPFFVCIPIDKRFCSYFNIVALFLIISSATPSHSRYLAIRAEIPNATQMEITVYSIHVHNRCRLLPLHLTTSWRNAKRCGTLIPSLVYFSNCYLYCNSPSLPRFHLPGRLYAFGGDSNDKNDPARTGKNQTKKKNWKKTAEKKWNAEMQRVKNNVKFVSGIHLERRTVINSNDDAWMDSRLARPVSPNGPFISSSCRTSNNDD